MNAFPPYFKPNASLAGVFIAQIAILLIAKYAALYIPRGRLAAQINYPDTHPAHATKPMRWLRDTPAASAARASQTASRGRVRAHANAASLALAQQKPHAPA